MKETNCRASEFEPKLGFPWSKMELEFFSKNEECGLINQQRGVAKTQELLRACQRPELPGS